MSGAGLVAEVPLAHLRGAAKRPGTVPCLQYRWQRLKDVRKQIEATEGGVDKFTQGKPTELTA